MAAPGPIRIPSIPPFPAPENWVRPAFLPPTPPPSPPPSPPPPVAAAAPAVDDAGPGGDGGSGQEKAAAADGKSAASSPSQLADASSTPAAGTGGGDGGGGADDMDVEEQHQHQQEGSAAPESPPTGGKKADSPAADGKEKAVAPQGADWLRKDGNQEKDAEPRSRQGDPEQGVEEEKCGEKEGDQDPKEAAGGGKPRQDQDHGVEEEKGGEKESGEGTEAAAARKRAEEAARKEAEAEEAAQKEEALKKAEAEAKAAAAEAAAEKRVRRLRVSLILKRLKEDAEERRRSGRYAPPPGEAGGSADPGVLAVPRLRDDRSKKRSAGGGGGGGSGPADSGGEATHWPPLGQRRLKRRLECAERHATLAKQQPDGGRVLRLNTVLQAEALCGAPRPAAGGGGWLETKLARMRKVEDGEWADWHRQVAEEAAANPGEAAGPPLPFGFVPRLAHRALGAYALVRTLSRPLRLTPASSVAFLRALALRLRTPLLDAVHCELLRRVLCLLKGRTGTWAKSTGAQRELDWKYLDQVRVFC